MPAKRACPRPGEAPRLGRRLRAARGAAAIKFGVVMHGDYSDVNISTRIISRKMIESSRKAHPQAAIA